MIHRLSEKSEYLGDNTFEYFDNNETEWCGALCKVYFIPVAGGSILLEHDGSDAVADYLRENPPEQIKYNGELRKVIGFRSFDDDRHVSITLQAKESEKCVRERRAGGEIGGPDAWSCLHPERQLTFGECETISRRESAGDDLLRFRGFLR